MLNRKHSILTGLIHKPFFNTIVNGSKETRIIIIMHLVENLKSESTEILEKKKLFLFYFVFVYIFL